MIQSIIDQVWDALTSWIPPQLLTPEFLGWFWIVVGVVIVSAVLGYFIPMLRSLSGAVSMAAIALVIGMWKGIGYAAARQRQKDEQARKAAQQPARAPFEIRWPFG